MPLIYRSVMEAVGRTPLVKLQNFTRGIGTELLVKLDYRIPGGSTMDGPLVRMIEEAEQRGESGPDCKTPDSSSGNFAVAMALAGAARGFRVVCVVDPQLARPLSRQELHAELADVSRGRVPGRENGEEIVLFNPGDWQSKTLPPHGASIRTAKSQGFGGELEFN